MVMNQIGFLTEKSGVISEPLGLCTSAPEDPRMPRLWLCVLHRHIHPTASPQAYPKKTVFMVGGGLFVPIN